MKMSFAETQYLVAKRKIEQFEVIQANISAFIAGVVSRTEMLPTERDCELAVGQVQESIGEMFFTELEAAREIVANYERDEVREHQRQESKYAYQQVI